MSQPMRRFLGGRAVQRFWGILLPPQLRSPRRLQPRAQPGSCLLPLSLLPCCLQLKPPPRVQSSSCLLCHRCHYRNHLTHPNRPLPTPMVKMNDDHPLIRPYHPSPPIFVHLGARPPSSPTSLISPRVSRILPQIFPRVLPRVLSPRIFPRIFSRMPPIGLRGHPHLRGRLYLVVPRRLSHLR